jgi:hypothetical protein
MEMLATQKRKGTTGQIMSAFALKHDQNRLKRDQRGVKLAYVGSVLNNGDTITDSPKRCGFADTGTWEPVVFVAGMLEGIPA